ncbi:uncharacterized protein KIAA0754-like [Amphibalanus amphitrite]|uniref:uncharacterized protein KIAA0754-like n=1 Tax=Amphibalanus amphitrite TaxID=1232801 RepID=UPI001C929389|nr:uncharacterized protein KIAA0754-like [Amphibalanus amphitrite]XP_043202334.1 uncharacterized protein KIAA0754-like [Amphibalanus amphitrite]XP_043202335.1 uncharacterized protein KIAA0754-like [Amphibalanus amphitrite]XP_043202336.1 uncharacterized protein KIAA0754-like [Amphibalanus amphitrite]
MRPDKKGNRRRDERRNGPKTAPPKPAGSQKPSGHVQKTPAVAQPTPSVAPQTPAAAPLPPTDSQGPRVLEPAAPPPSDTARYRRREIHSNWHRYEEEPDAETTTLPDEDFLRGDTFEELLAASTGDAGHFQLRSERSWLESGAGGGARSSLLTLEAYRPAAALSCLPLPRRLGVDERHFTEEELHQFTLDADTCQSSAAASRPAERAATPAGELRPATERPTAAAERPSTVNGAVTEVATPAQAAPSLAVAPAAEPAAPPVEAPEPPAEATPPAEKTVPPSNRPGGDVAPLLATESVKGPAPAPALLQDDWLDSVLSDED